MKEVERKVNILLKLMECGIEIATMRKNLTDNPQAKKTCEKAIREFKKAIRYLPSIRHEDIINSLYNSLVVKNEIWFFYFAPTINHKNTRYWDTTENGYKEFLELEKEAKEIAKAKHEEQMKQAKAIEEAKANGDKIEMVYNPETKKLEQKIVKVDNNA